MREAGILVVEDEVITAIDIKSRLLKLNYKVLDVVFTGEEAIKSAEILQPDLILMDIVLKGQLDGTKAAQIITESHRVPIIFLTAYEDNKTFNRAKLCVPYAYITKPFQTKDLQKAIELALYKHQMELQLAIVEKRYHTIIDNVNSCIVLFDREGIIYDINKQGCLMLGDTKKSIIGKKLKQYIFPDDHDYYNAQFKKLLIERKIGPNEGELVESNGKIVNIEFSASNVKIGNTELLFSIITDTTLRNKMRYEALLSDKLSTIGTLTIGIIHEMNNPLTWILANLSRIHEEVQSLERIDEKRILTELHEIIAETVQGANELNTIVKNLKSFTRIDTSQLSPVNINEIIMNTLKMVASETKNKVKIITDLESTIPLILITSSRLQQVFLNLIMNAIQALPGNNIEKNRICIKTQLINNSIKIDIHDNGIGIPQDVMANIFEPFFTTKPVGIGTGLGLTICTDILHGVDGKITGKSTKCTGTKFSVRLPVYLMIATQGEAVIRDKYYKNKSPLKILIISKRSYFLKNLEYILKPYHTISLVKGGRKALEILKAPDKKFDLIISDLHMADVSGADIYRYVIEKYNGFENKIIFIIENKVKQTEIDFLNTINNFKLIKPFDENDLHEAITQLY